MDEHLPLVIRRPAGVQPAIANRGFKWRGCPEFKRLCRLDIIMAIQQNRRLPLCVQPIGIQERVARSGKYLYVFQSDRFHVPGYPLSGFPDIGRILGIGADAGDGNELTELVDVPLFVCFDVCEDGFHAVSNPEMKETEFQMLTGNIRIAFRGVNGCCGSEKICVLSVDSGQCTVYCGLWTVDCGQIAEHGRPSTGYLTPFFPSQRTLVP